MGMRINTLPQIPYGSDARRTERSQEADKIFGSEISIQKDGERSIAFSPQLLSRLGFNMRSEAESNDSVSARKVQKADREKLRRDRLNEQFIELGNSLDPDRPKNCKATILADTIQTLKDLTAQVSKLKDEYSALTEEAKELTQEKNDLREEKASLKSDIDSLNAQYQQRLRSMYPWAAMDHSVVMAPPSYSIPVPVPMPPGPIPMHPPMPPYPFFGNQNPGVIPNPCSTFIPYVTPNMMEQQSTHHVSPHLQTASRSHNSSKQDSRSRSSDHRERSRIEKTEDSNDVGTDLELKTPGSTGDEDASSGQVSKKMLSKGRSCTEASSSSRCSSPSVQNSSSNSSVGGVRLDDRKE